MEIKNLLLHFFDDYLVKRDMESALAVLAEDVVTLGTGAHEVALNKKELRKLMEAEFESIPGSLYYEIRQYHEARYQDGLRGVYCGVVTFMKDAKGGLLSFQTRLTATAVKLEGEWKFINLHMSVPSDQQEEEFFPIKCGRREMGKLDVIASRKLVEVMMSMLPGGIVGGYLEDGFPLYTINDTMLSYLGYTYEELAEKTGELMKGIIAPEDWERVEKTIYESIKETGEYDIQYRVVRKDGTRLWVDDKGHEITTEDGRKAMISVMLDISEDVKMQEKLRRETMEDPLTGIWNRKGAILYIEKYLKKQQPGALFLVDIDNFKKLNDTYGHQSGDQILIELAGILKKYSRDKDVVARIGGDEFLLFLPGCIQKDVIRERAECICAAFKESAAIYDKVKLSVSIGIAVGYGNSTLNRLLKKADDCMYEVKKEGKDSFKY